LLLLLLPQLSAQPILGSVLLSIKLILSFLDGNKCASKAPAINVKVQDTALLEDRPILAFLTGSSMTLWVLPLVQVLPLMGMKTLSSG